MNKHRIGINISSEMIVCRIVWNRHIKCFSKSSYIYYNPKSTEIRVGDAVKFIIFKYPYQIVYDILKLIGSRFKDDEIKENIKKWKFKVIDEGGEAKVKLRYNNRIIHLSGIEILSEILKYIKKQADESCGNHVNLKTECVISIPTYLTDYQRECIKVSCERANLKVLKIISSSICANIGYSLYNKSNNEKETNLIFNIDYDGLIIDILKCDYKNKEVKLIFSKYDKELSMNRIIDNVCNYCTTQFKDEAKKSLNDRQLYKLRNDCEKAVRLLSCNPHSRVNIELLENEKIDETITSLKFDRFNKDIFKSITIFIMATIEEAELKPSDIDNVVLVGYGSRINEIKEFLNNTFCNSISQYNYNPEEICVIGASYITNHNDFNIKYIPFIPCLNKSTIIFDSTIKEDEEKKNKKEEVEIIEKNEMIKEKTNEEMAI